MIVCISPSSASHEQTVNALRYAAKVYDLGGGEPCEGLVSEDFGAISHSAVDTFSDNSNRPTVSNVGTKSRSTSATRGMIRPKLISPPTTVKEPTTLPNSNIALAGKEFFRSNSTSAFDREGSRRNSLGSHRQKLQTNPIKANSDASSLKNVVLPVPVPEEHSLQSAWSLLSFHKNSIAEMVEVNTK